MVCLPKGNISNTEYLVTKQKGKGSEQTWKQLMEGALSSDTQLCALEE